MEPNEKLENVNKKDNVSRVTFALAGLFAVLFLAAGLYFFVFQKQTPGGDRSGGASAAESSGQSESPGAESSDAASHGAASGDRSVLPVESHTESEPVAVSENSPAESSPGEEITDHGWVINNLGYTYLYYGIGLEQFTYSSAILDEYAKSLNTLYSLGGNSRFFHILVPTRGAFIDFSPEVKKEFYNANQRLFMNTVFSETEQGITNIDLYETFKEKYDNGEYIYYNTDPNYTHLAAYTAYEKFCLSAGKSPISESFYPAEALSFPFYGKFFTATGAEMLYENADVFYYYDIDEAYKSNLTVYKGGGYVKKEGVIYFDVPSYSYYCFLSDEAPKIEITTKVNAGKSVLVIGDSSAAPFVTFLVPHYDKITYINSERCNESILDLLSSGEYDDIVVINYNTTAAKKVYEAQNKLAGVVS